MPEQQATTLREILDRAEQVGVTIDREALRETLAFFDINEDTTLVFTPEED